ncbi:methylated-DNA--protein-cysteine methyltransferase [Pseudomyrmex gracilis]|uniref:methylated-DNA--protein-cysteine methyltransferase n=1 Tax=Pseudomyrmex gracilis TaxID=219809 RepID=UPI0009948FE2|nr:methylated-DNA--protein-cysteine methyltransferase [Pseudomyrmex gracilis]
MVIFRSVQINEYLRNNYKPFNLLYAFRQTPFGKCLIAITDVDEDVAYLAFVDENEEATKKQKALEILRTKWRMTETVEDIENKTLRIIEKIFYSDMSQLESVSVLALGTEFQIKVWKSLLDVSPGTFATYEDIARMIDHPKAVRAVGNAVAGNNIGYLVPCHRVRHKCGIDKYGWGEQRKKAIQQYEIDMLDAKDYKN